MPNSQRVALLPAPTLALPSVRDRFWVRLWLWLSCLAMLLFSWIAYNGWSPHLRISLASFPFTAWLAALIYRRGRIGLQTKPALSEWEMLIAYLLLAIGVASGILLLIAVGWISIGVVCLRPARPRLTLQEWFKLPFLCLLLFPLELDLAGSRHDWIFFFSAQSTSASILPSAIDLARIEIALRLVVLALAFGLQGPAFWIFLPAAPVLTWIACQASAHCAKYQPQNPFVAALSWIILAFVPLALVPGFKRAIHLARRNYSTWHQVKRWAASRSYSIWLVALVVLLQQSSLAENWFSDVHPRLAFAAGLVLGAILFLNRFRTSKRPVQLSSRLCLASALFVLLTAEWTDSHFLRHVSLGLLIMSGFSWRRRWPIALIASSMLAWIILLPSPRSWLAAAGVPETMGFYIRTVLVLAALAAMLQLSGREAPTPSRSFVDPVWQPSRRFAFTLLFLVMWFQLASGIWPYALRGAAAASSNPTQLRSQQWSFPLHQSTIELELFAGSKRPTDIVAPERILKADGWIVTSRRWITLPHGHAVALSMQKHGATAAGLYWFATRNRSFPGYLAARHVLWSGWNLNHRDLKLVLLTFPSTPHHPESRAEDSNAVQQQLLRFVRASNWFESLLWND